MMQVWDNVDKWHDRRRAIGDRAMGFVPTMGALHRGHASLVERCRAENEIVVVSIFVNPTQFNDPQDLERYPRTLDRDLALLESLGVDDVLAPAATDFYPHGYRYRVEPTSSDPIMEAAHRPGFIQGVLTVVMKLLNVVRARRAYFGEKDFHFLYRLLMPCIITSMTSNAPYGTSSSLILRSPTACLTSNPRFRLYALVPSIIGAKSLDW